MKEIFFAISLFSLFILSPLTASAIPAFPGAQGGGAESKGGRGGRVIEVTNLNDSGTGSLRACVLASGPRTCVFRVGGTINLLSGVNIKNPYLTVAGQTAPGGGIQLSGKNSSQNMIMTTTNDMVFRYLRIRKGRNTGCVDECGAIFGANEGSSNVIGDHLSIQWNQDEGMSAASGVHDLTYSYNLIGEGIRSEAEFHSTGMLFGSSNGQTMTNLDAHHNIMMNNSHRNPSMTNKSSRVVNNLFYNQNFHINQIGGGVSVDIIGNMYKLGPNETSPSKFFEIYAYDGASYNPGVPSIFLSGNRGFHQSNPAGDQYAMAREAMGQNRPTTNPIPTSWRRSSPLPNTAYPIIAEPVTDLEASLLPLVGSSRKLDCNGNWVANRDTHDAKMINEYKTNTGPDTIYPDETGYGGFPTIANGTPCPDADHDGMPDQWETSKGLNPNNPADGNAVAPSNSGYTNLEVYLAGTGATLPAPPAGPPPPPAGPSVELTITSACFASADATDFALSEHPSTPENKLPLSLFETLKKNLAAAFFFRK